MTNDKKQLIVNLYRTKTIQEICPIVGYCEKTVSKVLKEEGVQIRSGPSYLRKGDIKHDWFKAIDSAEKAYFLGLLYADGNVYLKRNRVQITLSREDRYILRLFGQLIGHSGILHKDREYEKLIIESKEMCQDLIVHGCIPRKSLILEFPSTVPSNLLSHFVRGYFDGDGSVWSRNKNSKSVNITSTEKFTEGLKKIVNFVNWSKFYKRHKLKADSAGYITIGNRSDIVKFYDFIYEDSRNLFLKRKKNKFLC